MTKISNEQAYNNDNQITDNDKVIGSDFDTLKKQTKNYTFKQIRDYLMQGLAPETGGTLKFTEVVYDGVLTSPAAVANALDPYRVILRYEVLVLSVNGQKYVLKLQDLTIGVDAEPITDANFIKIAGFTKLGDGTNVLKAYNVSTGDQELYSLKSLGLDISIVDGNIMIESKPGNNLGDGIEVYKGLNNTTKTHEYNKLKSSSISITKELLEDVETGNILIELVESDDNKSFYVNPNSVAATEEGTIAKPYKSLKSAILAFKGNGTISNPQYVNKATIVLLSDVVIPATGDDSMTNFSINGLNINGNGYNIIYRGVEEYFISTAYLKEQDPKTTSSKLDFPIAMYFEDVTIISESVHGIVHHLNYTSPSFSGSQNTSAISFKNCYIWDKAYLSELASYTNPSPAIPLFGTNVKVQNGSVLAKNKYTIKNENVNWNGEGSFLMDSCKLQGSSSTILYNLNSSISMSNVEMNFNPYYINYQTETGGIYSPMLGIYFIYNHNTGIAGRTSNYLRIEDFKEATQESTSGGEFTGGVGSFYYGDGASYFEVFKGSFYSEKMNNLIQLNTINATVNLLSLDCTNVSIADTVYGAFKYNSTTPLSRLFIGVNQSIINNIKYDASFLAILPAASNAIINGTSFTTLQSYADNAEALAAGLIPNCTYFNTSTNIATRVV